MRNGATTGQTSDLRDEIPLSTHSTFDTLVAMERFLPCYAWPVLSMQTALSEQLHHDVLLTSLFAHAGLHLSHSWHNF